MLDTTILKQALIHKSNDSAFRTMQLGLMAGVYISIGATIYSFITSLASTETTFRFLGAMFFSVGLILVIFLKAQLFTGNNLMFINLFQDNSLITKVLRNWGLVYIGNFIGSILIVSIGTFIFSQYELLAEHLVNIAGKKTSYDFTTAYIKAIYCNILVCIAVILGVCSRTIIGKIIGIVIPITLFVFLDFEHSIANMFFVPLGLSLGNYSLETGFQLFASNIIPVTLGNITGGLIVSLSLYLFKRT